MTVRNQIISRKINADLIMPRVNSIRPKKQNKVLTNIQQLNSEFSRGKAGEPDLLIDIVESLKAREKLQKMGGS